MFALTLNSNPLPLEEESFTPCQQARLEFSIHWTACENLLGYSKPVEKCWQAMDFLPDSSSESFHDELKELQERSRELPDDYLVCLIGNMITEEALPTYQSPLNSWDGVKDETGASGTAWAKWIRRWTAEENRHGDVLSRYLYLTGRVDMRQIDKTTQYLIGSGMDVRTENNPYLGFIYTPFQERATSISHGNTGRFAKNHGDIKLAQICGSIAADEKQHESAYIKIVEKLFEIDPDYTMLSLEDMMRKKVVMPAQLMFDGQDDNLFSNYSSVAQRLRVYTAKDYADVMVFLIERWNVEKIEGISSRAQEAQDYICSLVPRIRKLEERAQTRAKRGSKRAFSWLFGKEVFV